MFHFFFLLGVRRREIYDGDDRPAESRRRNLRHWPVGGLWRRRAESAFLRLENGSIGTSVLERSWSSLPSLTYMDLFLRRKRY